MVTPVCMDASLAGAILLPEGPTAAATARWDSWLAQQRPVVVPPHFSTEVASAVRRASASGRISDMAAEQALSTLSDHIADYATVPDVGLGTWQRAWAWAEKLRRSNLYDALYLAVAEEAGAEFRTTDECLWRALEAGGQRAPSWVHLVSA